MSTLRRRSRWVVLLLIAILPQWLKRRLYRLLFGYRIHPTARVGVTLLDAGEVHLKAGTRIGHLNAIVRVERFEAGPHARIGFGNIIRGGERVTLGAYSTIMRLNVLNAIPDHDCSTHPLSLLELATGCFIVSEHRIDFTDRVSLGRNVILGGRQTSLWTHTRQQTGPIVIGDFTYVGSECRFAPGTTVPDLCIVGLGSVVVGSPGRSGVVLAGTPARPIRDARPEELADQRRRSRTDMPDDVFDE